MDTGKIANAATGMTGMMIESLRHGNAVCKVVNGSIQRICAVFRADPLYRSG